MTRRWLIASLLLLLVLGAALPASAGILTSGSYTYLLKGQAVELPVDILSLRSRYLVPPELLALFDLTPAVDGDRIRLERGPVIVEMRLGSTTAHVDGEARSLGVAPLRAGERLFIPAELLPDLAITLEVDAKFVLLEDHLPAKPVELDPAAPPFDRRWADRTWQGSIREGSLVGQASITLLTPDLLSDPALRIPWGTRQRLLSLMESHTLLHVGLKNQSLKAMAIDPKKLMLVDSAGRQYDYLGVEIAVNGAVSSPVAPGASRTSVLAFPKVDAGSVTIYHDGSGTVLGTVPAQ